MKQTLRNLDYIEMNRERTTDKSKLLSIPAYMGHKLRTAAVEWLEEWRKERTDAISEMFDNEDEYGIYPTSKFFERLDNFWMNKFNIIEGEIVNEK